MKISGLVLTKSEEKNISACLKSLSFCEELIVIDDHSTDSTRKIAKKAGAKVFKRKLNKNFSSQLNFGMKKAKNPWVFVLDADERVGKGLLKEIKSLNEEPGVKGYYVGRKDIFFGKTLRFGDVKGFSDLRLVRKGSGNWRRRVHQKFELLGKAKKLKGNITHYPHQNMNKFVESLNTWSSWHALANSEEGKVSSLGKIAFYPPLKFVRNFIFHLGLLDGKHGFVHALFMSFHSFLSWSKLWIYQKDKKF